MYTVKELADLADVSRRTLHYYDEIALLKPTAVTASGYRRYDETALLRLQQILFYREIGLDLRHIKEILDNPQFDAISALQMHRQTMQTRIKRLERLMQTVDNTIMHLIGEVTMSQEELFVGFNEEKQKEYEKEAVTRWGQMAEDSIQLWHSYSEERKAAIMQESQEIYVALADNMGKGADSEEVQALLVRWHDHLRYFYEPTIDMLAGLGAMYDDHPDFNATFTKIDPALPAFLKEAIAIYVDGLETAWLEDAIKETDKA